MSDRSCASSGDRPQRLPGLVARVATVTGGQSSGAVDPAARAASICCESLSGSALMANTSATPSDWSLPDMTYGTRKVAIWEQISEPFERVRKRLEGRYVAEPADARRRSVTLVRLSVACDDA